MTYIPKDAKWRIAEIVVEHRIEAEPRNVVHIDFIPVRADSPEDAFKGDVHPGIPAALASTWDALWRSKG
ncbi:hypothetical protein [Desulforhabdus amnigena]|jgi:hypothetical protein|uniref:Uncharacterized protein n=1 Tax=Desulforhabdus amnigena TaxID=40218 RepID=A0A9W6FW69_9BACT|nr:hypothetical protein [Desulforhabdus amnigena]NLJ27390.1 hypothetical protein [Deltaproteobacteria bacterium]GLI35942.1 hypothetical protein DAMNIGENAA_33750 [Desulforhabdus amnigena]